MYYLYMWKNKINNKIYIGQTTQLPEMRKSQHLRKSHNKENKEPLYRAMRKYGEDNFEFVIILECEENIYLLNLLEIHYIAWYNSLAPIGYNLDKGGRGYHHKERKENSIEAARIKNTGQKRNETQKKRMSDAHIGVPLSREHTEALARSHWKKVYIQDLNVTLDSVFLAADYLIANGYTKSKDIQSVKSCISQALTKNKKYLGMIFVRA